MSSKKTYVPPAVTIEKIFIEQALAAGSETMVSVRTKVCVAVLAFTWVWLIMSCQKTTILDTASLNIQVAEAQYISNGAKVAAANLIPNSTREVEIQWEGEYTLGIKITSSAEGAKSKVAQVSSPTGLKRQTLERCTI